MPQITGAPLIRIECPDGTARSARVFNGDVDITANVQSITWSLDVETRYATVDIRFILPAASVAALQPQDSEPEYTRHGDDPIFTVRTSRITDSLARQLAATRNTGG